MTKVFEYTLQFLIFPGFLFSSFIGLMVGWVDRKVTARVQWRVGPPWYQNFIDVVKLLFYKETLIPEGVSPALFLGMPLVALASATLVSTMILVVNFSPSQGFLGDLLVMVYLLIMPPVALILGGFASRNSLASLGASREMKLMLSYELPFILALAVPIIKSGYAIKLGDIILSQGVNGIVIGSVSGFLSFIVMLFCIQAKLGFVPFDMPEAETEIMAGTYIEYSGKALGIFKLAKHILAFIIPMLMVTLYFGGIRPGLSGSLKTIGAFLSVLVLMIVIKNTNPRVRIDQAVKFFWGKVTFVAVLSVVLAYLGF
ncbi:MAG: NADH-quinone oxidoreductase subunit H [Candidatus Omnitrophica bacterium]|nr:NADH-quinone oxidoreductase subunit H [Candidatus Omnitrophota bacterium]